MGSRRLIPWTAIVASHAAAGCGEPAMQRPTLPTQPTELAKCKVGGAARTRS